jgi:hypothetical protein
MPLLFHLSPFWLPVLLFAGVVAWRLVRFNKPLTAYLTFGIPLYLLSTLMTFLLIGLSICGGETIPESQATFCDKAGGWALLAAFVLPAAILFLGSKTVKRQGQRSLRWALLCLISMPIADWLITAILGIPSGRVI